VNAQHIYGGRRIGWQGVGWIHLCGICTGVSEIGLIFSNICTTIGAMAIRTVPLDSGRRIGLSMYLQEVLTRARGHASPGLKTKLKSGKSDRISFISVQLREPRRNGWHRGFSDQIGLAT